MRLVSDPVARPGDTVVFEWTARDTSQVHAWANVKSTGDAMWYHPMYGTSVAVPGEDGIWSGEFRLQFGNADWPAGTVTLSDFRLSDGKNSSYGFSLPAGTDWPSLEVTGTEFGLGPRIEVPELITAEPAPGQPLRFRFRAEDMQGINYFDGTLRGPGGFQASLGPAHPEARNVGGNLWEWESELSTDATSFPTGTYWISRLHVSEKRPYGDSSTLWAESPDASTLVFEVTDPAYTAPIPTISGTAQVGHTLTVEPGEWGPGEVALSYEWVRDRNASSAATGASFVPSYRTVADERLYVRVTGTWPDGTVRSRLSEGVAVAEGRHGEHKVTFTGTAAVENVLVPDAGPGWPENTYFDYVWIADGKRVAANASDELRLGYDLYGKTLILAVWASTPGYQRAFFASEPVTVGKGSIAPFESSFHNAEAVYGSPLRISAPDFDPAFTAKGYAWYRDGMAIAGATGLTYTPTAQDIGKKVTARGTFTHPAYNDVTVTYSGGPVYKALWNDPTTARITGTARVGSKLTATSGPWPAGTTLTYRWYADGKLIKNAAGKAHSGKTYTPVVADWGKTLLVRVTPSSATHHVDLVGSPNTKTVGPGLLTTKAPTISGTAKVGTKLTAKTTGWTSGTTKRYQWYRDGKEIRNATKSSYTPTRSDRSRRITVKVTASKVGYATASRTSSATAKVSR
ncbi:hypothetical protein GCM10023081_02730 [Arthrobacter ginkgonis]|uniref:Uncharacterized protein n=1 Tax=Arthrobacter ginkgonis TaxID=1630594 RepID=A0ABP7BRT3_9MICC